MSQLIFFVLLCSVLLLLRYAIRLIFSIPLMLILITITLFFWLFIFSKRLPFF